MGVLIMEKSELEVVKSKVQDNQKLLVKWDETISAKSNVRAFVILKDSKVVAKVWFKNTTTATLCEVFTPGKGITHRKKATGFGYDKETAALSGAIIAGLSMEDHCDKLEDSTGLAGFDKLRENGFIVIQAL